jgi:hypothetical protein
MMSEDGSMSEQDDLIPAPDDEMKALIEKIRAERTASPAEMIKDFVDSYDLAPTEEEQDEEIARQEEEIAAWDRNDVPEGIEVVLEDEAKEAVKRSLLERHPQNLQARVAAAAAALDGKAGG